jgi:hypothetical protein
MFWVFKVWRHYVPLLAGMCRFPGQDFRERQGFHQFLSSTVSGIVRRTLAEVKRKLLLRNVTCKARTTQAPCGVAAQRAALTRDKGDTVSGGKQI